MNHDFSAEHDANRNNFVDRSPPQTDIENENSLALTGSLVNESPTLRHPYPPEMPPPDVSASKYLSRVLSDEVALSLTGPERKAYITALVDVFRGPAPGNILAADQLTKLYRRRIEAICRRMGCGHHSEDVLRELMLKAVSISHNYDPERGALVSTWLGWQARNVIRHYCGRTQKDMPATDLLSSAPNNDDGDMDADWYLESLLGAVIDDVERNIDSDVVTKELRAVESVVEGMDQKSRIIYTAKIQGIPDKEIGQVLHKKGIFSKEEAEDPKLPNHIQNTMRRISRKLVKTLTPVFGAKRMDELKALSRRRKKRREKSNRLCRHKNSVHCDCCA